MGRPSLFALSIIVGAIALTYQLAQLYSSYSQSQRATAPRINVAKLVADLSSQQYEVVHGSLMTVYSLAGVDGAAQQLLEAGIHKHALKHALTAPLTDPRNELLPLSLLSLSRLVSAAAAQQGPETAESVTSEILVPGVSQRLLAIARTGVPGWIACTVQLLHELCESDSGTACESVTEEVLSDDKLFVSAALTLLEAGALANHTDSLSAGARLVRLLTRHGPRGHVARDALLSKDVVQLLTQALDALAASKPDVLSSLMATLVNELRAGSNQSFLPVSAFVQGLIKDDGLRGEAVTSGLLSICAQVLFQATPAQWATGCADMLCDTADREAESSDTHTHGSLDTAGLDRAALQRAGVGCLIQTVKNGHTVPVISSALHALRDIGTSRTACDIMVEQGVLPVVASLLATTDQAPAGSHGAVWLMQAQRHAATLVALLSLHAPLRPQVIQADIIESLTACIRRHQSQPGLPQQLRVTAVASLVPILGKGGGEAHERVMRSGLAEDLVSMVGRDQAPQEKQVAERVLKLLERHMPRQGQKA